VTVNDATGRARRDLAAAHQRLARLEADLAAVPGWLRVGDPARHADPGDRAAAERAASLAARIDDARRAVALFAARLERLLGDPPSSIFGWVAMTAWLESLPADRPERLLEGLATSPERLLAGAGPMPRGRAAAILAYIAGNGGRVGDGEAFRHGVPLDAADLADLQATGDRLRAGDAATPGWDVLLPVGLETRFVPPDPAAGDPAAPWRLRVRVEPDAPALASRAAPVRRDEAVLVATCWSACGGSLDGDAGAAAFRALADAVGGGRAAYLLRTVPVVRDGAGLAPADDHPERPEPETAPLVGLPDTLELWGGSEEAPELLLTLRPDRAAIVAEAGLGSVAQPDEQGRTPRRWWNSYAAAEAVGLAGEVPLGPDRPRLGVLVCLGYDTDAVATADLLRSHADAGRLGTMAPLTPTTTVAGAPTTDLGTDPGPWLAAARAPAGGAHGLAAALLGTPSWPGMPPPDAALPDAASAVVRALWPALWQRTVKDVAGAGEEAWRLGEWAGRHLHAFGPYPVLRVGDLPYGVLPVADQGRWTWRRPTPNVRPGDPRPELLPLAALPLLEPPLLALALAQGTAAGTDVDGILAVLEHVPSTRAYGSRQVPPTLIFAALRAALGGPGPDTTVAEWEEQFAYLRGGWPPGPGRRYSPVLDVEPWPRRVAPEHGELLRHVLDVSWSLLAEAGDESPEWRLGGEEPPGVLARLVRHALLVTQAEVARLGPARNDPGPPAWLLPLDDPHEFFRLASGGEERVGRVRDLPEFAVEQAAVGGGSPRGAAVFRQFEDVRLAVEELSAIEPAVAARVLPAVLDLTSHRTDAWWTGLADRRLRALAAAGGQPRLGCYGWVDDLAPSEDPTPPTAAGLLHAPGYAQALTAAVLRDHAVHHPEAGQWDIALDSASIRTAVALAEQVRSGVHLSEALGREVERRVGEPGLVTELRRAFPARPEWEGRRVCDGQRVLDAGALPAGIDPARFDDLRRALDAYADLLVTDALHDVVAGRATAAAESLEAAAGLGAPPELRLLRTQRAGSTVKTLVRVALPWDPAWAEAATLDGASPVTVADPALAALLAAELGDATDWTWSAEAGRTSLGELGMAVADVVLAPPASVGADAPGGTAPARYRRAAAVCGALGGGEPAPTDAPQLRGRLTRLRALAADLLGELATPGDGTPAAGRRWGLPPEDPGVAAGVLRARLAEAGEEAEDVAASAVELARRIRALVPAVLALPLACGPGEVVNAGPGGPAFDDPAGWLEVVASVRGRLARLELAQLTAAVPWPASLADPGDVWAPGEPLPDDPSSRRHRDVVVTFDATGGVPSRAVVQVDAWAETIPSREHTTWAAFGYDAPRARPPQAILLAVPADVDTPDQRTDVLGAVLSARRTARIRSVRPPLPPELHQVLPTALLLDTVVPAGIALAGDQ
jgi:hypothetical protein